MLTRPVCRLLSRASFSTASSFSFEGKTICITGAAAGIGQAMAVEFVKSGASSFALIDQADESRLPFSGGVMGGHLSETVAAMQAAGGASQLTIETITCDITDEQQVKDSAERIGELFGGKLDVLVNNAGVNGKCTLIKDMATTDFENTLKVNVVGTMIVCREMIPLMEPNGTGAIVNVASNVGKRGLPFRSDYVASKWALIGFTQVL
jgi:NAD(P)-dependent dehydrogenase (short-subunit alcohol dehydrogenase family)